MPGREALEKQLLKELLSTRTREIDCLEYHASPNPPILHRKETLFAPDHPLHAKFARLTEQEEKHGLLDDTARTRGRVTQFKLLDRR